jgi:hypothetical protein
VRRHTGHEKGRLCSGRSRRLAAKVSASNSSRRRRRNRIAKEVRTAISCKGIDASANKCECDRNLNKICVCNAVAARICKLCCTFAHPLISLERFGLSTRRTVSIDRFLNLTFMLTAVRVHSRRSTCTVDGAGHHCRKHTHLHFGSGFGNPPNVAFATVTRTNAGGLL